MKIILALFILLPQLSYAMVKLQLDSEKGKTEFLAVGNPGFLKIKGKGKGPKGVLTLDNGLLSGEISIDLNALDTGMELRNQHMKEKYLQVDKYPQALLKIKDQKIPSQWEITKPLLKNGKMEAILSIHGEEKPVTVTYSIDSNGTIEAAFELKITDYKLEIPSFMGVTVADKVDIQVASTLMTGKNE